MTRPRAVLLTAEPRLDNTEHRVQPSHAGQANSLGTPTIHVPRFLNWGEGSRGHRFSRCSVAFTERRRPMSHLSVVSLRTAQWAGRERAWLACSQLRSDGLASSAATTPPCSITAGATPRADAKRARQLCSLRPAKKPSRTCPPGRSIVLFTSVQTITTLTPRKAGSIVDTHRAGEEAPGPGGKTSSWAARLRGKRTSSRLRLALARFRLPSFPLCGGSGCAVWPVPRHQRMGRFSPHGHRVEKRGLFHQIEAEPCGPGRAATVRELGERLGSLPVAWRPYITVF